MRPQPEQWMVRAREDLRFGEVGLEEGFYAHVCFLSQQASEKALKAFLIAYSGSYPRIHSIAELLGRASSHVGEIKNMMDLGRMLDEYYIPTRYPDGVPGTLPQGQPSEQHASEALAAGHRIVKMCHEGIENREDL